MSTLDLSAVQAKTQDGKDPVIEKKAMEYAKRDWQMSIQPLFDTLSADESIHKTVRTALKSEGFLAKAQHALLDHKYAVLENAESKQVELRNTGLLFPINA